MVTLSLFCKMLKVIPESVRHCQLKATGDNFTAETLGARITVGFSGGNKNYQKHFSKCPAHSQTPHT